MALPQIKEWYNIFKQITDILISEKDFGFT